MIRFRLGGGSLLAILLAVVVVVIGALDWLGQHAAQIKAGTGTLILGVVVAAALAGAGYLVVQAHRARQQALEPAPPVMMTAEAVPPSRAAPAAVTAPAPRAIQAAPASVSYTIVVASPEQAEAILRRAPGLPAAPEPEVPR